MSLTQDLISLIRNKPIQAKDLDDAAMFTLDALATAYAGTATPVGKILRNWADKDNLDLKRQAMIMGALTHITETDDLHRASVTHPGCVVIPTALALGEKLKASPQQILTAILHGFEAMCRIGAAVGPTHYKVWHNTATCGPFGSAMAAASLLQLSDQQTLHALGNAGTQASGFWQFMETGAMSKHLHAGRASESGFLAAELAASGFTGSPEILEGSKGFFAAMCADPIPGNLLAEPEAPWQLSLTSIKPWPSCRHTHPSIDCALELFSQLDGETIKSIEINTYQAALDVCNRPEPENEYQAKFSLFHCVVIALVDGEVTLNSFDPSTIAKTKTLRLLTSVKLSEPYAGNYPQNWGSAVTVTTETGRILKAARINCKGDPELALDAKAMRTKAVGLLRYAGMNQSEADAICDQVLSLPAAEVKSTLFADFMGKLFVT